MLLQDKSVSSAIDPAQAANAAKLPPAVHYQRLADAWRLVMRRMAREAGLVPIQTAAGSIDLIDCLRSELNVRNGKSLYQIALLRSVSADGDQKPLVLRDVAAARDFQEARDVLGPEGRPVELIVPGLAARSRFAAHQFGYAAKQRLASLASWNALTALDQTRPCDMLCIIRMPGHLSNMLPVARRLAERDGLTTVFGTVDRRLRETILSAGMRWTSIVARESCEVQRASRAAHTSILELSKRLPSWEAECDSSDSGQHALLARRMIETLRANADYTLRIATGVHQLINRLCPKVLFIGNPYTLEGRVAIHVARQAGLPTVCIEHGSIFSNDPVWQENLVDKIFCWGEASRRALLGCDVADEAIVVTGAPRLDAVFQSHRRFVTEYSGHERSILVATSGPGDRVNLERFQLYIRTLYQAADLAPDVQWIVKLHKKDHPDYYHQVRPEGHPRVKIVRGEYTKDTLDIFDYLRPARALVTITSTSALDAMAVGVPVIAVDVWPPGETQGIEYLERDCAEHVRTAEELAAAATRAWNGQREPARDAAAEELVTDYFANRGTATDAVAQALRETILAVRK